MFPTASAIWLEDLPSNAAAPWVVRACAHGGLGIAGSVRAQGGLRRSGNDQNMMDFPRNVRFTRGSYESNWFQKKRDRHDRRHPCGKLSSVAPWKVPDTDTVTAALATGTRRFWGIANLGMPDGYFAAKT